MLARDKPVFQIGDHVYFKNKQPGKWDLKWRPGYRIVYIEHDRHFIHIENQATGKIQSCNVMDYINAATSGTLSPHVLPVLDLQRMLLLIDVHIQDRSGQITIHPDSYSKHSTRELLSSL